MKKILIVLAALGTIAYGSYAQTQRLNRTNTRPHNTTDTLNKRNLMKNDPANRMAPESDQDRNNPDMNTTNRSNTNGTRTNTNNTNTQTGNKR